jgi:hypothetical protein
MPSQSDPSCASYSHQGGRGGARRSNSSSLPPPSAAKPGTMYAQGDNTSATPDDTSLHGAPAEPPAERGRPPKLRVSPLRGNAHACGLPRAAANCVVPLLPPPPPAPVRAAAACLPLSSMGPRAPAGTCAAAAFGAAACGTLKPPPRLAGRAGRLLQQAGNNGVASRGGGPFAGRGGGVDPGVPRRGCFAAMAPTPLPLVVLPPAPTPRLHPPYSRLALARAAGAPALIGRTGGLPGRRGACQGDGHATGCSHGARTPATP